MCSRKCNLLTGHGEHIEDFLHWFLKQAAIHGKSIIMEGDGLDYLDAVLKSGDIKRDCLRLYIVPHQYQITQLERPLQIREAPVMRQSEYVWVDADCPVKHMVVLQKSVNDSYKLYADGALHVVENIANPPSIQCNPKRCSKALLHDFNEFALIGRRIG